MSPDRLLPSFKREVIDKKPEVFKIKALKDIRNLFDSDTCMFAGFGNRESVRNASPLSPRTHCRTRRWAST